MARTITLAVPSDPTNISILRTMTMAAVGRAEVGIDAVSDAGLVVDEAASILLAIPGASSLESGLTVGEHVELTLSTDGVAAIWPPDGFDGSIAHTVLESLAARVSFHERPESTGISILL